jgi:putative oxidoreductase
VQRLFSTFPNSWPGVGLVILRLTAAFCLVGVANLLGDLGGTATLAQRCLSLVIAVLIVLALGTPVAAVSAAVIHAGIMTFGHRYDACSVTAAALGLALARAGSLVHRRVAVWS